MRDWYRFIKAVLKREHPLHFTSWVALIGAVIYTISPIDLIPELLLPIVGYVDDLGLWAVMLTFGAREKVRYEAGLMSNAYDVSGRDQGSQVR